MSSKDSDYSADTDVEDNDDDDNDNYNGNDFSPLPSVNEDEGIFSRCFYVIVILFSL